MSTSRAAPGTFLTFRLHDETFGVEILKVREIVELDRSITRVPRTPEFMRGVMNLRGHVVPVVDLNAKLGFSATPATADTCVIIVEVQQPGSDSMILGAVADAVEEVLTLGADEILAPPPAGTSLGPEYLTGLARAEHGFILLMDVDAVLAEPRLAAATPPASAARA